MFQREIGLVGVKTTARILEGVPSIHVQQIYQSSSKEPLEGVYEFSLFANSVLTACKFVLPEETIVCEVDDIAEANDRYETAVHSGRQAALATKYSDELYAMKIGNVSPGARVMVELDYTTFVARTGNETFRLTIPTTIADWRYSSLFDVETHKPTFTAVAETRLSIDVYLEACTIKRMKCVNGQDCKICFNDESGQVKFSQQ